MVIDEFSSRIPFPPFRSNRSQAHLRSYASTMGLKHKISLPLGLKTTAVGDQNRDFGTSTTSTLSCNTQAHLESSVSPATEPPDPTFIHGTPSPRVKLEPGHDFETDSTIIPRKKRKLSMPKAPTECLAFHTRHGLDEVLAAVGFKSEVGHLFEKLAKAWYAVNRRTQVLRRAEDTDAFDHIIASFMSR
jgi:hypothetical protein